MPRTIEGIVESHRIATERRNAGLPIWKKTISIRPIIKSCNEITPEAIAKTAVAIAELLRASLPSETFDVTHADYDWNFNEAVEDLESWTSEGLQSLADEGESISDYFNGRVDEIYDWADRERYWLE